MITEFTSRLRSSSRCSRNDIWPPRFKLLICSRVVPLNVKASSSCRSMSTASACCLLRVRLRHLSSILQMFKTSRIDLFDRRLDRRLSGGTWWFRGSPVRPSKLLISNALASSSKFTSRCHVSLNSLAVPRNSAHYLANFACHLRQFARAKKDQRDNADQDQF